MPSGGITAPSFGRPATAVGRHFAASLSSNSTVRSLFL